MEVMDQDNLNTPITKIKNLRISSPDIKRIMVDKGYSNSISDKVLQEMNIKLNEATNKFESSSSPSIQPHHCKDNEIHIDNVDIDELDRINHWENQENKFNHIHNDYFNKMESIMNHYSIKRDTHELSNSKKKRRTLTGIEESPVLNQHQNQHLQHSHPKLYRNAKLSPTKIPNMSLSTLNSSFNSPSHIPPIPSPSNCHNNSSPIRPDKSESQTRPSPSRISPSRKSYNLNGMLTRKISVPRSRSPSREPAESTAQTSPTKSSNQFKHPRPFHKIESASAHASSVPKLNTNQPLLQKKSSIPTLNHSSLSRNQSGSLNQQHSSSSSSSLLTKPSIPKLQNKSSIPSLQKKSSIPTLQKKSSIPTLQKKPSVPSLNHDSHTSTQHTQSSLKKTVSQSNLSKRHPSSTSLNQRTHNTPTFESSIPKKSSVPNLGNKSKPNSLYSSPSLSSLNSKTYDKPTISSSQKSLDKFARFKNKFQ